MEMLSGEMSGSSPPLRNNHVRVVYPPVVSLPGGGPPLGSLFGRESCEARTHKRSVVSKDFKVWIRLVMTMAIVMVAWLVPIQGETMVAMS